MIAIENAFINYVDETFNKCKSLLDSKGHDYAEKTDRYSNFKEAGMIAGITPEQSIMNLIGVKMARLRQLTAQGKAPKHEAIEDTIQDAINYLLLLSGKIKEFQ